MAELHYCTGLTGGGGALDGLATANYADGDIAISLDASSNIHYIHEATKPGSITESSPQLINADDASGYWTLKAAYPAMGKGHKYGFLPSYNSTTVMDFSAGECMCEDNTHQIIESGTLSLDITASGANGLQGVSRGTDTTIHCHVIFNPATGAVAIMGSNVTSSPSLPSGYTHRLWV